MKMTLTFTAGTKHKLASYALTLINGIIIVIIHTLVIS